MNVAIFRKWGMAVALFAALGISIGLIRFWIFAAVTLCGAAYALSSVDPTLMKERLRPAGPSADRWALLTIRLLAVTQLAIAIADISRFHWSDAVPSWLHAAGMATYGVGLLVVARSMAANRFFSTAVRIQTDRGHRVVSQGPYAVVRHPGYLGMIVTVPAETLALGSWWALVVALAYSALIARRVLIEDRYLHENLPGYQDYAARVRYRLIPGII